MKRRATLPLAAPVMAVSVTLDTTHSDGDGVGADVDTSSESFL